MKDTLGSIVALIIFVVLISAAYLSGYSDGQVNIVNRVEVQYPARVVSLTSSDLQKSDKSFFRPNGTKGKLIIKLELNGLGEMISGPKLKAGQRWVK